MKSISGTLNKRWLDILSGTKVELVWPDEDYKFGSLNLGNGPQSITIELIAGDLEDLKKIIDPAG